MRAVKFYTVKDINSDLEAAVNRAEKRSKGGLKGVAMSTVTSILAGEINNNFYGRNATAVIVPEEIEAIEEIVSEDVDKECYSILTINMKSGAFHTVLSPHHMVQYLLPSVDAGDIMQAEL